MKYTTHRTVEVVKRPHGEDLASSVGVIPQVSGSISILFIKLVQELGLHLCSVDKIWVDETSTLRIEAHIHDKYKTYVYRREEWPQQWKGVHETAPLTGVDLIEIAQEMNALTGQTIEWWL